MTVLIPYDVIIEVYYFPFSTGTSSKRQTWQSMHCDWPIKSHFASIILLCSHFNVNSFTILTRRLHICVTLHVDMLFYLAPMGCVFNASDNYKQLTRFSIALTCIVLITHNCASSPSMQYFHACSFSIVNIDIHAIIVNSNTLKQLLLLWTSVP